MINYELITKIYHIYHLYIENNNPILDFNKNFHLTTL